MEITIQTDAQTEREAQQRWRLLPKFADVKSFDRLVENEFLDPDFRRQREVKALKRIIAFANTEVPYYRDIMAARRLDSDSISSAVDLARLPLPDKLTVRHNEQRLRPAKLPRGEQVLGVFSS